MELDLYCEVGGREQLEEQGQKEGEGEEEEPFI